MIDAFGVAIAARPRNADFDFTCTGPTAAVIRLVSDVIHPSVPVSAPLGSHEGGSGAYALAVRAGIARASRVNRFILPDV